MNNLYFLLRCYNPNTATSTRILGYLSRLDELGIFTTVFFLMPNNNFDRINVSYKNIRIIYAWDKFYINHRMFKYLSYLIYLLQFYAKMKKGDKVYMYGGSEYLPLIVKKTGIDVYYECTEVPMPHNIGGKLHKTSVQEFYNACKKAKGVFVISTYLKRLFIENGIDKSKVIILNIIVDPKRFETIKKEDITDKYIAYCGTIENEVDGADQLIKAFALTTKKYPEIKLCMIGHIPYESDKNKNKQLIKQLGIEDKVIFLGKRTSEEIPQLLKNAQIVVLNRPDSVYARAGFPTKLGEYLMSGTPTIVTKVGDIPLFLNDMDSAILVDDNNPEEFSERMIWVIEHPREAYTIGQNGIKIALKFFTANTEVEKMIAYIMVSDNGTRSC